MDVEAEREELLKNAVGAWFKAMLLGADSMSIHIEWAGGGEPLDLTFINDQGLVRE